MNKLEPIDIAYLSSLARNGVETPFVTLEYLVDQDQEIEIRELPGYMGAECSIPAPPANLVGSLVANGYWERRHSGYQLRATTIARFYSADT